MSFSDDDADDDGQLLESPRADKGSHDDSSSDAEDIFAAKSHPNTPVSAGATIVSITCSRLISASPNAALFLGLLPLGVAALVDPLVEVNAWRHADRLAYLDIPKGLSDRQERLVDQQGHDVLVRRILSDDPDVSHR